VQRADLTVGACAEQIINLVADDAPGDTARVNFVERKRCIFYGDGLHDPLKATVLIWILPLNFRHKANTKF
jgi:hypothetical protein